MRCGWRSQRRVLSPFSLSCSHWRIGQGRCRERARQRQAWMAKPMGKILEVHTVREWKEGCERDFGVLLESFTWQHGVIRAVHGERDAERVWQQVTSPFVSFVSPPKNGVRGCSFPTPPSPLLQTETTPNPPFRLLASLGVIQQTLVRTYIRYFTYLAPCCGLSVAAPEPEMKLLVSCCIWCNYLEISLPLVVHTAVQDSLVMTK